MGATDDAELDAYDGVRARVVGMMVASPDRLHRPVPACPAWSVRELLGHLVGIAEDWVAGRLDGYGSSEWTEAQVAATADRTVDALAESWRHAIAALRLGPRPGLIPGLSAAGMLFFDAVVHEADLRPVLAPGTRVADEAIAMPLKTGVSMWRAALSRAGSPPLLIRAIGQREWKVGDTDATSTVLEAEPYELWRTLFGRRSRAQAEALLWSDDPSPFLDVGLAYPFAWSAVDLVD